MRNRFTASSRLSDGHEVGDSQKPHGRCFLAQGKDALTFALKLCSFYVTEMKTAKITMQTSKRVHGGDSNWQRCFLLFAFAGGDA